MRCVQSSLPLTSAKQRVLCLECNFDGMSFVQLGVVVSYKEKKKVAYITGFFPPTLYKGEQVLEILIF